MPRQVRIAAIQMDAAPQRVEERFARAERLIKRSAANGAQIIVLPELFNTGYTYTDDNFRLAEPMDGQTVTWMKATARKYGVYILGSLLLRDNRDIYDSQLLVSPDGYTWHYDKTYPWAWERAYFCGSRGVQVADTELGRFGLLICWDVAHAGLWASYAGKVDAMLISSCPPLVYNANFLLPDGLEVRARQLGPFVRAVYQNAENVFGDLLRRQSAWLGVPIVNTTATGKFSSHLPRPHLSLALLFAARLDLWKYVRQADKVIVEEGYYQETYIADAQGVVLKQVPEGEEGFVISTLTLADDSPCPTGKQPSFGLNRLAYFVDWIFNQLLAGYYLARR